MPKICSKNWFWNNIRLSVSKHCTYWSLNNDKGSWKVGRWSIKKRRPALFVIGGISLLSNVQRVLVLVFCAHSKKIGLWKKDQKWLEMESPVKNGQMERRFNQKWEERLNWKWKRKKLYSKAKQKRRCKKCRSDSHNWYFYFGILICK